MRFLLVGDYPRDPRLGSPKVLTCEGFGLVVVEAMSQRLPVEATPFGCALTLIEHERTGLVVPPREADAIAAACARPLGAPALCASLADAAFTRVREMTSARTSELTLAVYPRALDQ